VPELPEVETIRRRLRDGSPDQPGLVGKVIESAQVLWARCLATPGVEEFSVRVTGQSVSDIGRRGKFMIFYLTQDALLVHLRMSGDLLVEGQSMDYAPHHRLLINFNDGLRLAFNDTRKFGRLWLVKDPQEILSGLGPEPLEDEFTPQWLYQSLQSTRRQLKPLLLDQSFLAGVGNIYADEALHKAHLHPLTPAERVTPEQAERLWRSIRAVLDEGINRHGASIDWVYRGGDFQNYFRVYKRAGEPCPECGALIERIVVGQRGTHYCPGCQPLT
jgi:formamidopyrimidine-DNA glycosylase